MSHFKNTADRLVREGYNIYEYDDYGNEIVKHRKMRKKSADFFKHAYDTAPQHIKDILDNKK